jgi:transcriptional regulator with GAF, ATPase, and Fis domain
VPVRVAGECARAAERAGAGGDSGDGGGAEAELGGATVAGRAASLALVDVEREHIRSVLAQAKGMVAGPGGAASLLGVPPSTLRSRMAKLGIKP